MPLDDCCRVKRNLHANKDGLHEYQPKKKILQYLPQHIIIILKIIAIAHIFQKVIIEAVWAKRYDK